MEFSTAKWTAGILGFLAVLAITVYFILDEKDMMIPAFSANILPILTVTMVPVIFLLGAMLMAYSKKEERISKNSFQRALVLIACLVLYKVATGYFS
ncbi:hypothetical protein ACFPRA_07995 [Sporosarcina soli]|uniref:Uncharacterized protein n=1 Tax=Sporosarcina soli TaxID=334736 RepID=A0ABW0TK78_9BACL